MANANNLLDLLGGLDFSSNPTVGNNNSLLGLDNLLATPSTVNNTSFMGTTAGSDILGTDIFGVLGDVSSMSSGEISPLLVYDKNDFKIVFNFKKSSDSSVRTPFCQRFLKRQIFQTFHCISDSNNPSSHEQFYIAHRHGFYASGCSS
jgi:hypothetical protein